MAGCIDLHVCQHCVRLRVPGRDRVYQRLDVLTSAYDSTACVSGFLESERQGASGVTCRSYKQTHTHTHTACTTALCVAVPGFQKRERQGQSLFSHAISSAPQQKVVSACSDSRAPPSTQPFCGHH
eukprot:1061519-Pelagomonas_calceolata.AAC.15